MFSTLRNASILLNQLFNCCSIQMNERIRFVYFSIDHKIDKMGGNAHTD
jgi:hypothetical protein